MARCGNSLGWPKAVIDAREKQENMRIYGRTTRDSQQEPPGKEPLTAGREPRPRVTRIQPTDIGQWLWQLIRGCLLSDNQGSAYDRLSGLRSIRSTSL